MILIIDKDNDYSMAQRLKLYRMFALNTYACTPDEADVAITEHRAGAIYIPRIETIDDPVSFCRHLKQAFPKVPLITPLPKVDPSIPYDALYPVTDNIPLTPLPFAHLVEIIAELQRIYTGRDHMQMTAGPLTLYLHAFTVAYAARLFSLTPLQLSILRYVAEAHPNHVPASELCRYAGCPNRPMTKKGLQTNITLMNEKVRSITGYPILFSRYGKGFRISSVPFRKSRKN